MIIFCRLAINHRVRCNIFDALLYEYLVNVRTTTISQYQWDNIFSSSTYHQHPALLPPSWITTPHPQFDAATTINASTTPPKITTEDMGVHVPSQRFIGDFSRKCKCGR
ncbi:hypothetical protein BDN70DRAFT_489567 [Pholiota conissans]|uniref:Uncharacterized protein n=1 Tax=Pholiota conissans TaxID=109636 RepID=A0A9P5YNW7_9AGAR|nr:hypothetical protein BDN70DRAFT_489567 [Pholiota conissans]